MIDSPLKSIALLLLVALVFSLLTPSAAIACPTCKDGLANGSSHSNMVLGYQASIIFMMLMPFLILGGLGTYFYLEVRKARALQAQKAAAASPTAQQVSS